VTASASPLAIDARGVRRVYTVKPKPKVALDGIDLQVEPGELFGLLGPNGAGKTTLIRLLLGLAEPTAGSIRLLGAELPAGRAEALARTGAIIEEPRFHRHLTGRENLLVRRETDDPLHDLTPREREVLGLMAEGRSNAGIADALVLTVGAVEKHVQSIMAKLRLPQTATDHRRVLAVLAYLQRDSQP
jgi:ABC-type uncharacterized transport system ATPase subunit